MHKSTLLHSRTTSSKAKQLISFQIKNDNTYNVLTWSPLHPLGVTSRRMKNICPNKEPDFRYLRKCGHRTVSPELLSEMKNKYFQFGSCHKSARLTLNRCKNADTRNITNTVRNTNTRPACQLSPTNFQYFHCHAISHTYKLKASKCFCSISCQ